MAEAEAPAAPATQSNGATEPQAAPDLPSRTHSTPDNGQAEDRGDGRSSAEGAAEEELGLSQSAEPKTYEVTIDGQKLQVTEDDLVRSYQLGSSSRKRFEEAAKLRKEAQALREAAEKDPMSWLREQMGQDQLQYAMEQEIARLLQLEQMDPNERQRIEVEQERQRLLQERQQWEQQQQEQKISTQAAEYERQIVPHFAKALHAVGIEPDGDSIARMASQFQVLFDAGQQVSPMTLQHAARQVRAEYDNALKGQVGRLQGESLLTFLGEPVVNEVRKAILARVQQQQPAPPRAPEPRPGGLPEVPRRRADSRKRTEHVSLEDLRDALEESRSR